MWEYVDVSGLVFLDPALSQEGYQTGGWGQYFFSFFRKTGGLEELQEVI